MKSEPRANPMIEDLMHNLDADQIVPARRKLLTMDVTELIEMTIAPENADLLQAMCADSYIHPNGFYKLSFPYRPDSPVRVRLHLWPGKTLIADEPDAHNHKWAFASKVLIGALTHDVLRVDAGRGGHCHYQYMRVDGGHQYINCGSAGLRLQNVEITTEGRVYSMDSGTVHRVYPADSGFTATIVVELAPARATTDVFVANGQKPEGVTIMTDHLEAAEIGTVLNELVRKMSTRR
jgi:hypothetical protein